MALTDFVKGRTNRIVIGSTAGVGLILTVLATFAGNPKPALRVETPDNERTIEISTYGAIGVGTGSTPFGSAGDCLKSGGGSGTLMSFGTCGAGGSQKAGQGLSLNGSTFSISPAFSGTTLTIYGTASGKYLHAEKGLSSSGTLVWEGAGSGASLWVSTFDGAGLSDCDLSTQKVLWDTTTKRFSCGTDQTGGGSGSNWSNTGSLLTFFNGQYVNQSGDTMTGALTINLANATSGIGLNILETASGNVIHAEKSLTSSGFILSTGNISTRGTLSGAALNIMNGNSYFLGGVRIGSSAAPSADLHISGTIADAWLVGGTANGNYATMLFGEGQSSGTYAEFIRYSNATGTDGGTFTVANLLKTIRMSTSYSGTYRNDLTVNPSGNVGIGTSSGKTKLEVMGSMSGMSLVVNGNTNIAGNLRMTGSTLGVGNISTRGTLSGNALTVMGGNSYFLASVGFGTTTPLVVDGYTYASTAKILNVVGASDGLIAVQGTTARISLVDTNASVNTRWMDLLNNAGETKFSTLLSDGTGFVRDNILTMNHTTGNIGLGTTGAGSRLAVSGAVIINPNGNISTTAADTGLALEVIGTASGVNLYATRSITGSHLYSGVTFAGAGLVDCDTSTTSKLLWDSTTKRFSCGTDQTGNWSNTGSLKNFFDGQYVNQSGDTMTGALTIQNGSVHSATNTPLLNVRGIMSGAKLLVSGYANITGALLTTSNITSRATISGAFIRASSIGSVSTPSIVIGRASNTGIYDSGINGSSLGFTVGGVGFADFWMTGSRRIINSAGTFELQNSGNIGVLIDSAGRVGVGSLNAPRTSLEVYGAISGANLRISGIANVSGALLAAGNISTRGTLSGAALTIMNGNSYILGNTSIGTSGNAGSVKLNVAGTMSGKQLVVSGTGATAIIFTHTGLGRVGVGTILPRTTFEVVGTMSGRALAAGGGVFNVTSTGMLTIRNKNYVFPTTYSTGTFLKVMGNGSLIWSNAGGSSTNYTKVVYAANGDSTTVGASSTSEIAFDTHTYDIPANDLVANMEYEIQGVVTMNRGAGENILGIRLEGTNMTTCQYAPAASGDVTFTFRLKGTAAAGASVAVASSGELSTGQGTNNKGCANYDSTSVATNSILTIEIMHQFLTSNGSNNVTLKELTITRKSTTAS